MPSTYDPKDIALVNKISKALDDRHIMNINENGESMTSPPPVEDPIFPQVKITYKDIKEETDREKIRIIAVDNLAEQFDKDKYNVIHDRTNQSLIIQTKNHKSFGVTDFDSLKDLEKANSTTLSQFESSKKYIPSN